MSNPITVKGYVCSVPRAADARQASVAVVQDDVEYRIIPRGAGADLADEVSALVEVTGLLEQVDEVNYIQVRGYRLVDDTSSWDDDEYRFHGTLGPALTGGRCRAVSRLPQDGLTAMSAARQACGSGRASPGKSLVILY